VQAKLTDERCDSPRAGGNCYLGKFVPGANITDPFYSSSPSATASSPHVQPAIR
jgi:hypothetical protein